MGSILFVHGTGVRQKSYEETFGRIAAKTQGLAGFRLERCLWGEVHGSRLLDSGSAIPGYSGRLAAAPEDEVVKWWLLYQNPYFEIESLHEQGERDIPPRRYREWEAKSAEIATHRPSPEFQQLLDAHGFAAIWRTAFETVTASDIWRETLPPKDTEAREFFPDFCRCTAEAIVAVMALEALAAGIPVPTGEIRDRLMDRFLIDLNAKVRGLRDWFAALRGAVRQLALGVYAAGDYAMSKIVTKPLVRNFLTDHKLESIGDILYYQARGEKIRGFIRQRIEELDPPVFLLAHSLGGIACVDLLIEEDFRGRVRGLITAGSQSPLFYEMNCLVSRPRDEKPAEPPLPDHFPRWLNFYDPNDYLSYAAREVFKSDRIEDRLIASRQPRLMAHGAYWSEPKLWERIFAFIEENRN